MVTIACEELAVGLGGRTVLEGISARFEPGQVVGVIGPNGAGKSTLVKALLGLQAVQAGRVLIDDANLAGLSRQDLARKLAYLPQGQTLHWPLTVERLVALGRLPHQGTAGVLGEADRRAVQTAMEKADVLALRARRADQLSGGERARVLLARALAVEAPGLIVDEPLASLDPGHQITIMELLQREARSGALVVAVLHDLALAARYCDRLLLIDGGRLVAQGLPQEVLTPASLERVYGIRARFEAYKGRSLIVPLERV